MKSFKEFNESADRGLYDHEKHVAIGRSTSEAEAQKLHNELVKPRKSGFFGKPKVAHDSAILAKNIKKHVTSNKHKGSEDDIGSYGHAIDLGRRHLKTLKEDVAANSTGSVGVAASDVSNIGRKKRKYSVLTRGYIEIGGKRKKIIKENRLSKYKFEPGGPKGPIVSAKLDARSHALQTGTKMKKPAAGKGLHHESPGATVVKNHIAKHHGGVNRYMTASNPYSDRKEAIIQVKANKVKAVHKDLENHGYTKEKAKWLQNGHTFKKGQSKVDVSSNGHISATSPKKAKAYSLPYYD